jgi:hypothetical protein
MYVRETIQILNPNEMTTTNASAIPLDTLLRCAINYVTFIPKYSSVSYSICEVVDSVK